jgi:hypothetical protein
MPDTISEPKSTQWLRPVFGASAIHPVEIEFANPADQPRDGD